jgi:ABC-type Mn2+/Zn2+ transport system ATPase subunit
MSLGELLELFASLYGAKADVDELLGFVNLQDKRHAMVKDLSGGQKQRFTLASSLVNNPEILFLDEPTTGLDPRARRDVWELVRKISARGITIVLTTQTTIHGTHILATSTLVSPKYNPLIIFHGLAVNTTATTTATFQLPPKFLANHPQPILPII